MPTVIRRLLPVLFFLCAAALQAATYYVDAARGDDTRAAQQAQSADTPWATLPRAAKEVQAWDTVLVQAGTYTAGVSVAAKGTADKPIIFKAMGDVLISSTRELPKEMAASGKAGIWSIADPGPVAAIYEDPGTFYGVIETYRSIPSLAELEKASGGPTFFYDATAQTLYLKPFSNPADPAKHQLVLSRLGLALHASGEYITFEGFRIEYAGLACQLDGAHNTARRLRVWQCGGGVRLVGTEQLAEYNIIQACGGAFDLWKSGTVRNNTVYGTRGAGVGLGDITNGVIVNNIFITGSVSGGNLYSSKAQPNLMMDYNVWGKFSNYKGRVSMVYEGKAVGSLAGLQALGFELHGLQSDPLLINQSLRPEADFRLQTRAAGFPVDSPCVNGGSPAGTDIGALPVETPAPQDVTVGKAAKGARLQWSIPWATGSLLDGFAVYRRAGAEPFKKIAVMANPDAVEYLDPEAKAGCEYQLTSLRYGGTVESAPSVVVKY
ncbi:MAG: right-handed parallel beta-helix repeat-containing protein [Armatimonadota bacterium]